MRIQKDDKKEKPTSVGVAYCQSTSFKSSMPMNFHFFKILSFEFEFKFLRQKPVQQVNF